MKSITQREFRNNSAAVMDAVEAGETYHITRNGAEVAELRPLHRRWRSMVRRRSPGMSGWVVTGTGSAAAMYGSRAAGPPADTGITGSIMPGCGQATAGACVPVIGSAARASGGLTPH